MTTKDENITFKRAKYKIGETIYDKKDGEYFEVINVTYEESNTGKEVWYWNNMGLATTEMNCTNELDSKNEVENDC